MIINYRDSPALVSGCVMEDHSDRLDYCNALWTTGQYARRLSLLSLPGE